MTASINQLLAECYPPERRGFKPSLPDELTSDKIFFRSSCLKKTIASGTNLTTKGANQLNIPVNPLIFMVLQAGFEPAAPGLGILYNTFKIIQLQTIVAILGANSTEKHLTIN